MGSSAPGLAKLEKHLFHLKFASKEMLLNSKKCDKMEKADREKCKKAIKQGNLESAKIHAENAIRQKNQSLNYLRMSARLDGVANKVQNAVTMRRVTNTMSGIVKSMDSALKNMNLEKISILMDKFEEQSETLDVHSATVDNAMGQTFCTAIPQAQVDGLMLQIADEAGLELRLQLPQEQFATISSVATTSVKDDLSNRLQDLRKI